MSISRRDAMIAAVPAAALLATAAGAQTSTTRRVGGGRAVNAGPGGMNEDPLLAAKLLGGGKRQIEVCTFAKTLTKNAEVLKFLQAEIDEHETIKAKVKQQFGFEPPMPAVAAAPAPAAQPGVMPAPMIMIGTVTVSPPASNLLMVDSEIVDQCIANYKAKMPKKSGLKLDKAIIGDQLHEHGALQDKVQVFMRHASAAMQPVLKEGLAIIVAHIAKCEEIMEMLDGMKDDGTRPSGTGTTR